MRPARNCTTRGTGSDTHGSHVETGPRGSAGQPTALAPGGSRGRERAGHPAPVLFPAERPSPGGSVASMLPGREAKQREEAQGRGGRVGGRVGTQAPELTILMGTPGPRDEKRPPHPAGRGDLSSGKTAFLHAPPPSSHPLKRWLPSSKHAGVVYLPPPPSLPDAGQEQGTTPTGTPIPKTLCPRQGS